MESSEITVFLLHFGSSSAEFLNTIGSYEFLDLVFCFIVSEMNDV